MKSSEMHELTPKQIAAILVKYNFIVQSDLDGFAKSGLDSELSYLYQEGLITDDLLGQALGEYFEMPFADLDTNAPSREEVQLIPKTIAEKYRVVPYEIYDAKVVLATDTPKLAKTLPLTSEFLEERKVEFRFGLSSKIENLLKYYNKDLGSRLESIITSKSLPAPKILDAIFMDAVSNNASDIHFEPIENEILIRFRVDGALMDITAIPKDKYDGILNKIKVDAKLRIDQHETAMDGAIRYDLAEGYVDLRVSIIPTVTGEKVVIRVLSRYLDNLHFSSLGISEENQVIITESIKRPHGMIIVTGPTGSGKTTTLYSILKKLNLRNVNITTIEDPVEYRIKGINQIQVNKATELTFSQGLRSIVRQDPDIILVGEIRDQETAEIAVNSALTGHLLLTTFHSNTASAAIPRLVDMGSEPYLLSSTIEIIIAQRLVRKLCEGCRYSKTVDSSYLKEHVDSPNSYFETKKNTLYFSKGCEACKQTGYKGRIGIYEIVRMTPEMKKLLHNNPSADEIWKLARQQGAISMFEDGISKAKSGITTIEEVVRVASPYDK